jgi:Flp pilus assembly pilin Flp
MRNVMKKLWQDDAGWIISVEMILIFTIVSLGLIVGLTALRNALVDELTEVANAITAIEQCYSWSGLSNCSSSVCGSAATDKAGSQSFGVVAAPTAVSVSRDPCTGAAD